MTCFLHQYTFAICALPNILVVYVYNGISIKDAITELGVLQFCIITRKTTNWFYTTQ